MERLVRAASVAAVALLMGGLAGCSGRQGDEPNGKQDEVRAPAPKRKVVSIPLESIYFTRAQKGLRLAPRGGDDPLGREMGLLLRRDALGPMNVFLVRGKDVAAAVRATRRAFTGSGAAGAPVGPGDRQGSAPLWLAAYLGTEGSTPPAWLVVSAERRGQTIRLAFERPVRDVSTMDSHLYFVWVPLGELEAGPYTLELFDAGRKEVSLARRVTVPGK